MKQTQGAYQSIQDTFVTANMNGSKLQYSK